MAHLLLLLLVLSPLSALEIPFAQQVAGISWDASAADVERAYPNPEARIWLPSGYRLHCIDDRRCFVFLQDQLVGVIMGPWRGYHLVESFDSLHFQRHAQDLDDGMTTWMPLIDVATRLGTDILKPVPPAKRVAPTETRHTDN